MDEFALDENEGRSRIFQGMVERLVGDNIAIEGYICAASLENAEYPDNHEDRTLDEETDARAGLDTSRAQSRGETVRLAVKVLIRDLVCKVLHSDIIWASLCMVLKGDVNEVESGLLSFSQTELIEELLIACREVAKEILVERLLGERGDLLEGFVGDERHRLGGSLGGSRRCGSGNRSSRSRC